MLRPGRAAKRPPAKALMELDDRNGLPRLPGWSHFLIWSAVIATLNWNVLDQPPVWDASMGLFPAAITLSGNGFDLGALLDQPGYLEAGPNVHSLSVVTWLTALGIGALGDSPLLFPLLHLAHFLLAGLTMVAVFRFSSLLSSRSAAWLISLLVLFFPLVRTQTAFMYFEIPLLGATVCSMYEWARGRPIRASLWATLAVMVKASGIIVPAALSLASLAAGNRKNSVSWRGAAVGAGLTLTLALVVLMPRDLTGPSSFPVHFRRMALYLLYVPDLLVLAVLSVPFAAILARGAVRTGGRGKDRAILAMVSLMTSFAGFYLLLPLVGEFPVLPRYYVQVFPFVVMAIFFGLESRIGFPRTAVLGAYLLVFFLLNSNGRFYPSRDLNNFAVQERSRGYRNLMGLQMLSMQEMAQAGDSLPVFYFQPAHYWFSYPLMGYSDGPIPRGHNILQEEPYNEGRLEDFPAEFVMVLEHPWLGGEIIRDVRDQAEEAPEWKVVSRPIRFRGMESELIHIRRDDGQH